MSNYDTLRQQIDKLFEKTEDKAVIETLGAIKGTIDTLEADTNELQKENKELIKDYKEVIKHVSFKPEGSDGKEDETGTTEPPKFEDFFKKK